MGPASYRARPSRDDLQLDLAYDFFLNLVLCKLFHLREFELDRGGSAVEGY